MIIGIGTDIVEINRIKEAVHKWGKRFLYRIYTENELFYCYQKKNPFPHLAGRFAAKESVIKAFSGIKQQLPEIERFISKRIFQLPHRFPDSDTTNNLRLREAEIMNNNYGMPFITINNPYFSPEKINSTVHLTISHERIYAIATVVIELKKP